MVLKGSPKEQGNGKKLWARARRKSLAMVQKIRQESGDDEWQKVDESPAEIVRRHRLVRSKTPEGVETLGWTVDTALVRMEVTAFGEGAMRQCFRTKKVAQVPTNNIVHASLWANSTRYVAKAYKKNPLQRAQYFEDVAMQAEAELWADMYNRLGPPKKIDMLQTLLVECIDREHRPTFAMERFITGSYVKHNSNSGFVDARNCRLTPHCFSHFTFHMSHGALMVVDIQGVNDLYTDPQIHTSTRRYGGGDMGYYGMALFFATHHCSGLCRHLGLPAFGTEASIARTPSCSQAATMVCPPSQNNAAAAAAANDDDQGQQTAESEPALASPKKQQPPVFDTKAAMQAVEAQKLATAKALTWFNGSCKADAEDKEGIKRADVKSRLLASDPFGHIAAVHASLARVLLDAREAESVAAKGVDPDQDADALVAVQHLLRCVELSAPRLEEAEAAARAWEQQQQQQQQQQNDEDDEECAEAMAAASIDRPVPPVMVFAASQRLKATKGTAKTVMLAADNGPTSQSQTQAPYPFRAVSRAWLALALAHSGELPGSMQEQEEAASWRDGDGDAWGSDGSELRGWRVGRACRPHDSDISNVLWEGAARMGSLPALLHTSELLRASDGGKNWSLAVARLERALGLLVCDKSDYEPPKPAFEYKEQIADMLAAGGHGLEQDKLRASEMYMAAGNEAMVKARDMFGSQRCFGKAAKLDT